MKNQSRVSSDFRKGNLHIKVLGPFTPMTVKEVEEAITDSYRGEGNIFIHTAGVTSVAPESRAVFTACLSERNLPWRNMYVTGMRSVEIAPDGIRTIVYHKKQGGCGGRCKNCRCSSS